MNPGRSPGPGAHAEPPELAAELIRRLNESDIRYALCKDRDAHQARRADRSDVDLIVAEADLARIRTFLVERHALGGFCHGLPGEAGPSREDWFVPDFDRADYIHLEVFPGLSTGRPSARDPAPRTGRTGLRRLIFSLICKLTRHSPALSVAKRRVTGGAIFALVGPDGVGKSLQVVQVARLFQRKFRCTTVYLGSGEGGWRLRRLVWRWYYGRRGRHRERSRPPNRQQNPPELRTKQSLVKALASLATAIERYVTLAQARGLARLGAIVISDRWPQNLQPGLFDGPSRASPEGPALVSWLASIERALYRRMQKHEPDLTIHMLIDFETSRARKPGDRQPPDFEQRLSLMRRARAGNPRIRIVDARKSQDEVTRDLFRWFWLMLRARAGGTHVLEDCLNACPAAELAHPPGVKPADELAQHGALSSLNSN